MKAAYYEKVYSLVDKHQGYFEDEAVTQFTNDLDNVLAMVTEAKKLSLRRKSTFNWSQLNISAQTYFSGGAADEAWRERFAPLLQGVMQGSGNEMAASFGLAFNVQNLGALQWYTEYELIFSQPINKTTNDTLLRLFQQGENEGWSIPTLENHIGTLFDQWMYGKGTSQDFDWYNERMPAYRRERIARTEVNRASNYGNHNLMRDWGVHRKEWLATADARTRLSHQEAWSKYSGFKGAIPIDEYFVVNGVQLLHPGDSSGGSESINCRCAEIPYLD